jgi:hypothetical protein
MSVKKQPVSKLSKHEYKNRRPGKSDVKARQDPEDKREVVKSASPPVHGEVQRGKKAKRIALDKNHQIYLVGKLAARASELSESEPGDELGDSVSPGVMQSLIDPLAIYTFKITTNATFASSAGGTLLQYITFDPTGATEYTLLSGLFDLVRVKEAKCSFTNFNPHSDGYAVGNIKSAVYIACDSAKTATLPTSIASVGDCPNLMTMCLGSTKTHIIWYKAPKDLNWATTSSPVPGPYAGCYGEWMIATGGLTVSVNYLSYISEIVYEFTSRT